MSASCLLHRPSRREARDHRPHQPSAGHIELRHPDCERQDVRLAFLDVHSNLESSINSTGAEAELIDVLNGWQIWGEQYHRKLSDILAVQEEISEAISARLKVQLTREEKARLGKRYTENPQAYRSYLKGRYHWSKFHPSSLRRAIDYFEQAIEIDPSYALAYAGLADSYYRLSNVYAPTREAMPKGEGGGDESTGD